MKISLVIPSFYPAVVYGGPIFATLHASESLADIGVEVYVSTTDANGNSRLDVERNVFVQMRERLWVKYYKETVIGRFSFSMLCSLWKDLKKFDVVHVQSIFSTPTPIALLYASLLRKKVLLSPRGSLCEWCLKEKAFFKQRWLKLLVDPFVKKVIWHATSAQEKSDILKRYPDADVVLISDGMYFDAFQKATLLSKKAFMERFCKKDMIPEKIIVSMGRIHKVKGFDILIEAFGQVLNRYPGAVLCIAGKDDGELEVLKRLVEQKDLKGRVFFTGPLYEEDKVDFLANADLFALPSHTENFGIVYAESLAAGTPVIASTNTPWQELEMYECGKWVENSIETTSIAMEEMLGKEREEMRKSSKRLAAKYDWGSIALQLKNVFEEMVKK